MIGPKVAVVHPAVEVDFTRLNAFNPFLEVERLAKPERDAGTSVVLKNLEPTRLVEFIVYLRRKLLMRPVGDCLWFEFE